MSHQHEDWLEALPLVLLGIRASFKEDISATSSELVYGKPLRLPGEFFKSSALPGGSDPSQLVSRLQSIFSQLQPTPTSRHGTPRVFVYKELKDCEYVFLREGPFLKALQPPYAGPYEVLRRSEKTLVLNIRGKSTTVSVDRVKPAFLLGDQPPSTTSHVSVCVSTRASSPASPSSSTRRTRHVHFAPTT
uniref:Uncharacterized protein n=1 Tax=Trichogramma kaykai TaxID=54128 RepID=A0ABD2VYU9_9HYME